MVNEALGDIQGAHALLGLLLRRGDKLVHAPVAIRDLVILFEEGQEVVGVEDRVFGDEAQALGAQGAEVGVGAHQVAEVAVEGVHPSDAPRVFLGERVRALSLHHAGHGEEGLQACLRSHGRGARPAAPMRRAERLVQVEMHHIEAEVPWARDPKNGVHVGAIHVDQAAPLVDDARHFQHFVLEEAQSVWIREHQRGDLRIHRGAKLL